MHLRMSTAAQRPRARWSLDPNEQRVIEEARARRLQRLARRELWSLVAFTTRVRRRRHGAGAVPPVRPSSRSVAVLVLIGAYAAAFRLEFEIGSGTAVPTELILVPMLFLLPTGWVPLAVAAGVLLGSSLECLRGDAAPRAPRAAPAERLVRDRPGARARARGRGGRPRSASGRSTWRRSPRSSRWTSPSPPPASGSRWACRRASTCAR